MKDVAITEILCGVHEKLHRRKIRKTNGFEFSANDMDKFIDFFLKEESAVSISQEAWVQIEGRVHDGYITVWRDGSLQIRLKH